ncbi:MAG: DUF1835 domain-containing protein [Chitinophagaceae bacterium]|nr:DUF1835 domain-containing protein [Chitinophagaceae bacterium]
MIHIVFEQASVEVLQKTIELDESLAGEIIEIKDDFAVGPIANIFEIEGYQQRRDWWKNIIEHSVYENQLDIVDDKLTAYQLIKTLKENEEEKVWIWMAHNTHDVCGYYWLISQLKEFQGRVEVLYLNNLPFINEKGAIFYPTYLHEIQPKEFIKAKKLARTITLSEFELDPDEWKKLSEENAEVRILEGGKKVVSKESNYYDKQIIEIISAEFQKLIKIIQQVITKSKLNISDTFIVFRIKQMAKSGQLEIQGDWQKGWKEIEVKQVLTV